MSKMDTEIFWDRAMLILGRRTASLRVDRSAYTLHPTVAGYPHLREAPALVDPYDWDDEALDEDNLDEDEEEEDTRGDGDEGQDSEEEEGDRVEPVFVMLIVITAVETSV